MNMDTFSQMSDKCADALDKEASAHYEVTQGEIVLQAKEAEIALSMREHYPKITETNLKELVANEDVIYRMKMQLAEYQHTYETYKSAAKVAYKMLEFAIAITNSSTPTPTPTPTPR